MNLIPITERNFALSILATEYGSTNNVIPLEAKKGFCFSIGYELVNNLWLLSFLVIYIYSNYIYSNYVSSMWATFAYSVGLLLRNRMGYFYVIAWATFT